MIAGPLTRRVLMATGFLGTAALSGCSASDLTKRKEVDPEAADRARLQQARDLSVQVRAGIDAAVARDPRLAVSFAGVRALHTRQIEEFTRTAGLTRSAARSAEPTRPLTPTLLPAHEHALAHGLRALALQSLRGDVAALLASAAAGIDQAVVR